MKPDETNPAEQLLRVLVIEDNDDDSELLMHQLRKRNFAGSVKVIPDGKEAWTLLRTTNSCQDLLAIFLDLNLPSLNGVTLLGRIRSEPQLCTIPIFVMTSSQNPEDLEECSRLGVEGYIRKPVTFVSFSKAIADLFHAPMVKSL
jgi:CheY-like chemotaxis protein